MTTGPAPSLNPSESFLSLRSKKSSQDIIALAKTDTTESYGRNNPSSSSSSSVLNDRVYGNPDALTDARENENLLNSEVIDIGNQDDLYRKYKGKDIRKRAAAINSYYTKYCCLKTATVVALLCLLALMVSFKSSPAVEKQPAHHSQLYFNGSHYFDTTVIYISLDGFRNDYLDRKVTPNIDLIAEQGIRAQYMIPSFPSITFPNHWTLVTGLYPEAHGIVANEFYDPILKEDFVHKNATISGDPKWWGGEPIWVTSKNQGKRSAVIMWPGSNVPINGVFSDYNMPYLRATTAQDKIDTVLGWLDLPFEVRPQSINVYIQQVDQKGHGGGPDGKQLNSVLTMMDNAIGHLMVGLAERNIDRHVHLVVVSDHGMAGSDNSRLIFYDEFISPESESFLRDREAWPLLGLRPKDDAPDYALDQIYNEIYEYTQKVENPHFKLYRREEVPARFHYNSTERIAPILLVPDVGYSIIRSTDFDIRSGKVYHPMGIHGYDNLAYEMRAIFAAKGPKIDELYLPNTVVKPFYNVEMYRFLTKLLDLTPAPNNATLNGIFESL